MDYNVLCVHYVSLFEYLHVLLAVAKSILGTGGGRFVIQPVSVYLKFRAKGEVLNRASNSDISKASTDFNRVARCIILNPEGK